MEHLHINNLWINGLLQAFKQIGLKVDTLSQGIEGIRDGRLEPGYQLDLVNARTIWHRAVSQSADPLLGVKVGLSQNPRSTGVLLPILFHSPSTRIALAHIAHFQTLISESGQYRVHDNNNSPRGCIMLEYVPAPSSVGITPQQIMSVVTGTLMMLKQITDNTVYATKLYLPPGMNAPAIAEALCCDTEIHPGNIAIQIPEDKLDLAIYGRDEHLYQLSLGYAEGLLRAKRAGQNFLNHIKTCIDTDLPAQVSIDDVALQLDIHRRTLQRNLKEQGTSFRQLKESLLKERTLDLLISNHLDTDSIAEQLGYADASTFHRAFKGWFNTTPKLFKAQMGDDIRTDTPTLNTNKNR